MYFSDAVDRVQSNWDKEFKKGEELFRQGCFEPNSLAQSHGWQCAKELAELRGKFLDSSRNSPKKVWVIQLTCRNGEIGFLMYGHKKSNWGVITKEVDCAEAFASQEKAEAYRAKECGTLWGESSKVVEVEVV